MQSAIDQYCLSHKDVSINSVSAEKKFLWENGIPINYKSSQTPKSQDLPEIVSLNFDDLDFVTEGLKITLRRSMVHQKQR